MTAKQERALHKRLLKDDWTVFYSQFIGRKLKRHPIERRDLTIEDITKIGKETGMEITCRQVSSTLYVNVTLDV